MEKMYGADKDRVEALIAGNRARAAGAAAPTGIKKTVVAAQNANVALNNGADTVIVTAPPITVPAGGGFLIIRARVQVENQSAAAQLATFRTKINGSLPADGDQCTISLDAGAGGPVRTAQLLCKSVVLAGTPIVTITGITSAGAANAQVAVGGDNSAVVEVDLTG